MGVWFSEKALQTHVNLNADLAIVEVLLRKTFHIDLNQHVTLFLQLRGERMSPPTA